MCTWAIQQIRDSSPKCPMYLVQSIHCEVSYFNSCPMDFLKGHARPTWPPITAIAMYICVHISTNLEPLVEIIGWLPSDVGSHAPLPQGVLPSARTTDGAAAAACLASKVGIHSFVLLLDRKNPIQVFKKTYHTHRELLVDWHLGWKTFARMQVLRWSWSSGYSETVIIRVVACWLVHRPRLHFPLRFA